MCRGCTSGVPGVIAGWGADCAAARGAQAASARTQSAAIGLNMRCGLPGKLIADHATPGYLISFLTMPRATALLVAHRVLIVMAMALSGLLLIHGISAYRANGDVPSLLTGLAAAGFAVGLGFYLRWFLRKQR